MDTTQAIELFIVGKQAKGLSRHTLDHYRYRLGVFAKTYPSLPTDPSSIASFLVGAGPSQENRETYYRLLRNFYNVLVKRHLLTSNPVLELEAPVLRRKVARALTVTDLGHLLSYPGHSTQMSAFLHLLADTGLRLSEALSVRAQDIGERIVKVTGKTGEREVPLSPAVLGMVLEALPWPWGSGQAAGLAVRKAFRRAGFTGKRASAQSLRHSFVRLWQGDETLLQGILGWTSLRMLKIYRPFDIKRAIEQHRQNSPLRLAREATTYQAALLSKEKPGR